MTKGGKGKGFCTRKDLFLVFFLCSCSVFPLFFVVLLLVFSRFSHSVWFCLHLFLEHFRIRNATHTHKYEHGPHSFGMFFSAIFHALGQPHDFHSTTKKIYMLYAKNKKQKNKGTIFCCILYVLFKFFRFLLLRFCYCLANASQASQLWQHTTIVTKGVANEPNTGAIWTTACAGSLKTTETPVSQKPENQTETARKTESRETPSKHETITATATTCDALWGENAKTAT